MAVEVGAGEHARRGWPGCRRAARLVPRRSGPTRTSEKSDVPPPMSATSTSCSLRRRGVRSRARRRSARTGSCTSAKPADRAAASSAACAAASRSGSSSTKNTGRPSTARVSRHAGVRLRLVPELLQIARKHIAVADRMAGTQIGALLDQRRAEDALHRAHQPAVGAFDIRGDRRTSVQPSRRLRSAPGPRPRRTPRSASSDGRARVSISRTSPSSVAAAGTAMPELEVPKSMAEAAAPPSGRVRRSRRPWPPRPAHAA